MKEIKMLAKILTELSVPDPLLGPPTAMMDVDLPSGLDVIELFSKTLEREKHNF